MHTYSTIKTGTSQDLMSIVACAYERQMSREGTVLPRKTRAQRALLEAPFNALGAAVHGAASCLPSDWIMRFHDRLFAGLSKPYSYPFDPGSPVLLRARELAARMESRAAAPVALVAMISHPPVLGEMAHMNFELVRHAMLGLRVLRGRPCRPRLVAAVDFFALDTVPLPIEGLYAGYMGLYHLGLDRLVVGRGSLSAQLISPTAWHRMAHRLIRELGRGREVGLAVGGGVPSTARVLYAAREWVQSRRRQSPLRGDPAQVLRRMRLHPDYLSFEEAGPCGPALRRNAWRMLEAWVMAAAAGEGEPSSSAEQGRLSGPARRRLEDCLEVLAIPPGQRALSLEALEEEFARETPYRARFFRLLAGRVLRRRPIVFLPIVHRAGAVPGIEIKEAWAWTDGDAASLRALGPAGPWQGGAEAFARDFIRGDFS